MGRENELTKKFHELFEGLGCKSVRTLMAHDAENGSLQLSWTVWLTHDDDEKTLTVDIKNRPECFYVSVYNLVTNRLESFQGENRLEEALEFAKSQVEELLVI